MQHLFTVTEPAVIVLAVDVSAAPGIQHEVEADLDALISPLVSVGAAAHSGAGWEVVWPSAEKLEVARVVSGLEGAPRVLRHARVVLDEGRCSATVARVRRHLHRGGIGPGEITDLRRTPLAAHE